MKHFFRAGRELPNNQQNIDYRSRPAIRKDGAVSSPKTVIQTATLYPLCSNQVLPWFYLCSTRIRPFLLWALYGTAPGSAGRSEPDRRLIEAQSERGRTKAGLGRVLVGKSKASVLKKLLSSNRYTIAYNALLTHCYYLAYAYHTLRTRLKGIDTLRIKYRSSKDIVLFTQLFRKKRGILKGYFGCASSQLDHSATKARSIGGASVAGRTISKGCSSVVRYVFYSSWTRRLSMVEDPSNRARRIAEEESMACRSTGNPFRLSPLPDGQNNSNSTAMESAQSIRDTKITEVTCQLENRVVSNFMDDASVNRLILASFRGFCSVLGGKVMSMPVSGKRGRHSDLNQLGRMVCSKWRIVRGLPAGTQTQCGDMVSIWRTLSACLMICCVLFSLKVPAQHKQVYALSGKIKSRMTALPLEGVRVSLSGSDGAVYTDTSGTFELHSPTDRGKITISLYGYADTSIAFDNGEIQRNKSVFYMDMDLSYVQPLQVGDILPGYLMNLPLTIINHSDGRKTISLREYASKKLVILDFWARWCAPCVRSLDEWEAIQPEFSEDLMVIGVYNDVADRAQNFIEGRGWRLPTIVGDHTQIINRHFFTGQQVGCMVFIKDGYLFAIPESNSYSKRETIVRILRDEPVEMINRTDVTYSPKQSRL